MSVETSPSANSILQARVQKALEQRIQPLYTTPCEQITASANELGEVYLSGLVHDPKIVAEAIRLIEKLPGVKCVIDHVTVVYIGHPVSIDS